MDGWLILNIIIGVLAARVVGLTFGAAVKTYREYRIARAKDSTIPLYK